MRKLLIPLLLLVHWTLCLAQPAVDEPSSSKMPYQPTRLIYKPMEHEKSYPRVEVYIGNPNGQQIGRETYLLKPEQSADLLERQLRFLPDFGEEKPDISLQHYVEMSLLTTLPQRTSLLPRGLDGYQSASEQGVRDLTTIIDFRQHAPTRLEIVWLDESTWFVNDVFYHLDLDDIITSSPIRDEKLMEVNMTEFMTDSDVVASKLNENFSHLSLDPRSAYRQDGTLLFALGLTPGGPGSSSYHFNVYTDGTITTAGQSYSRYHRGSKLSHHQVVSFAKALRALDLKSYTENMRPLPFVHDGQSETLQVCLDSLNYRLTFGPGGSSRPEPVQNFMTDALRFISHVQLESQR